MDITDKKNFQPACYYGKEYLEQCPACNGKIRITKEGTIANLEPDIVECQLKSDIDNILIVFQSNSNEEARAKYVDALYSLFSSELSLVEKKKDEEWRDKQAFNTI